MPTLQPIFQTGFFARLFKTAVAAGGRRSVVEVGQKSTRSRPDVDFAGFLAPIAPYLSMTKIDRQHFRELDVDITTVSGTFVR